MPLPSRERLSPPDIAPAIHVTSNAPPIPPVAAATHKTALSHPECHESCKCSHSLLNDTGKPLSENGISGRLRNFPLVILAAVPPPAILDIFTTTGAYLKGHFRLTSGLHSGEYLQCAKVLAHPRYASEFGAALGAELQSLLHNAHVDLIVSPAIGGLIIGHEVARALGVRAFFAERDAATREMTLRRGFQIESGERAIVIEDVITTGGSTREVVQLLTELGAVVVASGSIIDRSGGSADVGVQRVSLETLHPITYSPEECPLCRQGIPVTKPGSRPV